MTRPLCYTDAHCTRLKRQEVLTGSRCPFQKATVVISVSVFVVAAALIVDGKFECTKRKIDGLQLSTCVFLITNNGKFMTSRLHTVIQDYTII